LHYAQHGAVQQRLQLLTGNTLAGAA